ncbi:MAG: VWA domain-containing protein [Gammaproteobacteria bacterium]|nr:VWA domain-containing protein [Gammaproteobacteria bacterium]
MIEHLDQLTLRQPWWLLLLIVPLGIMMVQQLRPRSHQHTTRLAQFIAPNLWRWLLTQPRNPHRYSISWLLSAAWMLIAIAASSPHFSDSSEKNIARSIDIAVVIDISPSMAADDIAPTRLTRAKLELRDFTTRLKADRTSLIAYSGNAYKVLPLTADRDTLHHFSDALETTLTRRLGSNLAQGLERAIQSLAHSEKEGRAIVLLTDGENFNAHANINIAKRLHKIKMPLMIMGVGTSAGGMVPNEMGKRLHYNGEVVVSRLEEEALQQLATTSGGVYTPMSNDDSDWESIFRQLDKLEALNSYRVPYQPQQFQFFSWLIAAAILLFIISGIRQQRANLLLIILSVLILTPPSPAHATSLFDMWHEKQAFEALSEKRHAEAAYRYSEIDSYNGQSGYGVAAYRQQQWQVAADAFSRALLFAKDDAQRAQAHYNRGNALSRIQKFDDAANDFETALHFQSNFSHAALNLNLVNQARMQQGGVQESELQKKPQIAAHTSHDNEAQQSASQLASTSQQSEQRNPQNQPETGDHSSAKAQQQTTSNEQPSALPTGQDGDTQSINWDNALQQAQAINKRLGHTFMKQRFSLQEEGIKLKAEEKPW